MTEPSASIWEVTRRILSDPDADPAEVASAYGYTMTDIAEMLPFVAENLQANFSPVTAAEGIGGGPPPRAPGESIEEHAIRWLTELRQSSELDLASYDSLDGHGDVADWMDAVTEDTSAAESETTTAIVPATAPELPDDFSTGPSEFGTGGAASEGAATTGAASSTDPTSPEPDVSDDLLADPLETEHEPRSVALDSDGDELDAHPDTDLDFE